MTTDWLWIDSLVDHQTRWNARLAHRRPHTEALGRLAGLLEGFPRGRDLRTAQTGCSLATAVFARFGKHAVFCEDDRGQSESWIDMAASGPGLAGRAEGIEWRARGDIATGSPAGSRFDAVWLEGAKPLRVCVNDLHALLPQLATGGFLILDDVHIPTSQLLYSTLLEERALESLGVTGTTAFFRKTMEACEADKPGAWWDQGFNIAGFPAIADSLPESGFRLPFNLRFDARLHSLAPWLRAGFRVRDGLPITVRESAMVAIPLWGRTFGDLSVDIEFEALCADERPDAHLTILINGGEAGAVSLVDSRRMTLSVPATARGERELTITFRQSGLQYVSLLKGWDARGEDLLLPGIRLHAVAVRLRRERRSAPPVRHRQGMIASFEHASVSVNFFVDQADDSVQCHHAAGRFYEEQDLDGIAAILPAPHAVLDVGANVGNHAVYFGAVMKARRVVVIEPLSRACDLMRVNVSLNGLSCVDFSHLGLALGAEPGWGELVSPDPRNVGGARVVPVPCGDIRIVPGDQLFGMETFDLVKVDVEGAELEVLRGLESLIGRCRPALFVEVWHDHRAAFDEYVAGLGYRVERAWHRYDESSNLLLRAR